MTNSIVAGHSVGVSITSGNSVTLDATLWHANTANWSGAGTIVHTNDYTGDPAFGPDGYHLTNTSAAIDRGVNAGVAVDIDGQARPQDAGYDLGADEFALAIVYLPIVVR
jgi:hypothetical protein